MPISSNRYVDITSAVGGGDAFPTRELLLRLFTTNERVPTGSVLNFSASSLDSLRDYFGSTSEEYKRAAYYFGFISKVATSPKNIQLARWADAATSAQVFGSKLPSLDTLKAYTAAAFDIVLAGVTFNVTALDFSAATTYADAATELQTQIQLEAGALAAATVVYDASRTSFVFDTNGSADGDISFTTVTAGLIDDLGFGESAVLSNGIAVQTVTDTLSVSTTLNNNFGSYNFIDELDNDQILESAIFADGRNVEFMNLVKVTATNRAAISALISGYASSGMVLSPLASQYPELLPAAILASLDYDKPAASANFMYYTDSRLAPSVTTSTQADVNDPLTVNYYGQTQEAGVNVSFLQRGRLTGGETAPKAMGVHANEQWLKAYLKSQFLNMFIALQQVPADLAGEAIGLSYIDAGVAKALENGSISVGKTLTTTQINYITQLTGNGKAYLDVQSRGYWYKVTVNATTNLMEYLLIYAKRDSVDKVEGRHSLI
jgi:hypothetical protein